MENWDKHWHCDLHGSNEEAFDSIPRRFCIRNTYAHAFFAVHYSLCRHAHMLAYTPAVMRWTESAWAISTTERRADWSRTTKTAERSAPSAYTVLLFSFSLLSTSVDNGTIFGMTGFTFLNRCVYISARRFFFYFSLTDRNQCEQFFFSYVLWFWNNFSSNILITIYFCHFLVEFVANYSRWIVLSWILWVDLLWKSVD